MKKKAVSLFLCCLLSLIVLLSACSSQPSQPAAPAGGTESQEPADGAEPQEPAAAEVVELRIHCDYTADHPTGQLLAEYIERVKNDSNGTVVIKPFYSGVLGDYTTVFDEVAEGSPDMMTFGAPSVSYGEKFNLVVFPYVANSWENAGEIYSKGTFVYDAYEQMCADINVKLLTLHAVGAGGLASAKMPAAWDQWGAAHDILLRVPNSSLFSVLMQEMGYNCQSINWSELFTSMQTGVIDAFVGGHPPACYDQFRDVIKYYIQINNFFEVSTISLNLNTFNSLTPEQQNALTVNADWVFEQSIERGEAIEAEYLQKMRDYGIEVIVPDQAVLDDFTTKCREIVWPQIKDDIGDDLYNGLVAASGSV